MSADEIRRLVRIYSAKEKNLKDQLDKFKDAEMTPNLENISIARKDAIVTIKALLAYAAMVERCEERIAHYSREVEDCGQSCVEMGREETTNRIMRSELNYILKGATNG